MKKGQIICNVDSEAIDGYRTDGILNHIHLLVMGGTVNVSLYSKETCRLSKGDFLNAVRMGEIVFENSTPDFSGKMIMLKRAEIPVIMESLQRMPLDCLLMFSKRSVYRFDEQAFRDLLHACDEIERIERSNHLYKQIMLTKAVQMFLMDLVNNMAIAENRNSMNYHNSELRIFNAFAESVRQEAKREHSVMHYSECLGITPQYLNKIVKNLTGDTASVFIRKQIMTDLAYEIISNKKPLKQIALDFNFSSLPALSSFVKRYIGKNISELLRESV